MTKKCLLIGGGLALLATLVFGGSYVRTAVHKAKEAVSDAEPLSYKIERAEQGIRDLEPEIRKAMHVIAKEEVAVQSLKEELEEGKSRLAKSEKDILRLKTDLEQGNSYYVYAEKSYSKDQVEKDLRNRFERHKVMQDTNDMHAQRLAAREAGLQAAHEKLTAMENARQELIVGVENLRARMKALEVAQASSELNLDDSKLARTKELVKDISTRIDVAEKLINAEGKLPGEINLDEPEQHDTLKEVAEYFGHSRPEGELNASK
jgi:DNA repair exonuclease SbcCD ATPase subunit